MNEKGIERGWWDRTPSSCKGLLKIPSRFLRPIRQAPWWARFDVVMYITEQSEYLPNLDIMTSPLKCLIKHVVPLLRDLFI